MGKGEKMPRYIISLEKFDEQLDREIGLEEVVMCKDCKYYGSDWWIGDCHHKQWGDGWGNYPPPTVTEDGFCAWGERREDAEI